MIQDMFGLKYIIMLTVVYLTLLFSVYLLYSHQFNTQEKGFFSPHFFPLVTNILLFFKDVLYNTL